MDNNISNLNTDKLENITSESIGDLSDVDTTGVANNNVLKYNSTSGNWEVGTDTGGLSNVVDDTSPQLGGNLDVNGNSIVSASAGNITITPDTTGSIVLDGVNWPQADGSADQFLKTNGAGQLSYASITQATGSELSNVVEDTTPQLGGDLDCQGNTISNPVLEDYAETIHSLGSTDTPTITIANGNVQSVTITSGLTLPAFSDAATGQSVTLIVSGSGTASGTAAYKFAGGNTTLTTLSVVSIFYDGTNYFASIATDFQ